MLHSQDQCCRRHRLLSWQSFTLNAGRARQSNNVYLVQKRPQNRLLGQPPLGTFEKSSVFLLIDFEAGVPLGFIFAKLRGSRCSAPLGQGITLTRVWIRCRCPGSSRSRWRERWDSVRITEVKNVSGSWFHPQTRKRQTCIIFESPDF